MLKNRNFRNGAALQYRGNHGQNGMFPFPKKENSDIAKSVDICASINTNISQTRIQKRKNSETPPRNGMVEKKFCLEISDDPDELRNFGNDRKGGEHCESGEKEVSIDDDESSGRLRIALSPGLLEDGELSDNSDDVDNNTTSSSTSANGCKNGSKASENKAVDQRADDSAAWWRKKCEVLENQLNAEIGRHIDCKRLCAELKNRNIELEETISKLKKESEQRAAQVSKIPQDRKNLSSDQWKYGRMDARFSQHQNHAIPTKPRPIAPDESGLGNRVPSGFNGNHNRSRFDGEGRIRRKSRWDEPPNNKPNGFHGPPGPIQIPSLMTIRVNPPAFVNRAGLLPDPRTVTEQGSSDCCP